MDFQDYLAEQIEATGHRTTRDGQSLVVEGLELRVESFVDERIDHDLNGEKSVVFQIRIFAIHPSLSDGIWDVLAGIGETEADAFHDAASKWSDGIFLTIHEFLLHVENPDLGVEILDMVSRADDTGEYTPWKMYLGALQVTGQFVKQAEENTLRNSLLATKLLGTITGELYRKKTLWIKLFAAKGTGVTTSAECWLNNEIWPEGTNDLYSFANEWDAEGYNSMKQFLILRPTEWSEKSEKIKKELEPEQIGFFRKLFKREQ
jgi:hypothetical protein